MSTEPLLRRKAPDFNAEAVRGETVITACLVGTADLRAAEELEQFVAELHEATLSQGVNRLCVDLRQLEFMSSCCFKSLVSWLAKLEELPRERQYEVRFLCDPDMMWQRRGMRALTCFAADLVSVDSQPAPSSSS
jgi:hypothetical protein